MSPLLFNIYIDDLIVRLSNSGFGVYIGNVFSGCIMYGIFVKPMAVFGISSLIFALSG